MGLFRKKEKDYDCRFSGIVLETENVTAITKGTPITVSIKDNVVKLSNQYLSSTLNLDQISSTDIYFEHDLIEKQKSVIGRGIAGGVLAGPLGAVIGGLSGTTSKTKKTLRKFLVLNFISSSDGKNCSIVLEADSFNNDAARFVNIVRQRKGHQTLQL
ncbi:MAG: hypothetical protein VB130_05610 [Clostridium sp.]|nr:hypothetical protein [Clostridium sp.]